MKKKWLLLTVTLTFIIGGVYASPVLAFKSNGALTLLEKIGLYRSNEHYTVTKMVNSALELAETSQYLLPSSLVESHHREIKELADELTLGLQNDEEKSKAIFTWVATNVVYDTDEYFRNPTNPRFYSSLETLRNKVALCSGYANLNAALHRAKGIEAKVVYGEGHAWNEINLSGTWQEQDPTYGSGGLNMEKQIFIPQFKEDYYSSTDPIREGEFPW